MMRQCPTCGCELYTAQGTCLGNQLLDIVRELARLNEVIDVAKLANQAAQLLAANDIEVYP